MMLTKKGTMACAAAAALIAVSTGAAVAATDQPPTLSAVAAAPTTVISGAVAGALALPELAEYGAEGVGAKALQVAGESWTVIPGTDGSLCLDIGAGTITCGTAKDIAAGQTALISIAPLSEADDRRVAAALRKAWADGNGGVGPNVRWTPTRAVRRGLVADGVATVRAVDSGGALIAQTKVSGNAYVLDIGVEGQAAAFEMLDADGRVTATAPGFESR